jgi:probable phosphoglycerate mutase
MPSAGGELPVSGRVRVTLVRHGETEWSENGRHTSVTDLALLPVGRDRAARLVAPLSEHSYALVLCSPLRRARETCELAGFGDRAEIVDQLREWNYGEYEGLTTPEIRQRRPDWSLWRDGCPGGESPAQVQARAEAVIARLQAVDGEALAFAHGHILRVLAARWVGLEAADGARLALSPGSISILAYERETPVIGRWNAPG